MARLRAICAFSVAALLAADGALAQGRGGGQGAPDAAAAGRARAAPERPTKPATAETEAWLANTVQVGDGWRVIHKDAEGVVLARPAGAVRNDGVVAMHLRVEFVSPLTLAKHEVRSVQADLNFDCAFVAAPTGNVSGFEGQNLTGKKHGLEGADLTVSGPGKAVETQNPRVEGLKLVNMEVVRQQCAEGHQAVAARYAGWRPLLSDEKGVRLVQGAESYGLDRKLDLKFRIEAKDSQSAPELKWRSALANVSVDCVDGAFNADTTLYAGQDESGASAKLVFDGYQSVGGLIRTKAVGAAVEPPAPPKAGQTPNFSDTGPGKTVVDLLRNGAMVAGECDAAKARLTTALATHGDPLRQQAERWASSSLNTKGFRLPTYVPEGVLMLSDEVVASGQGRRALVRAEFSRPVPTRDGKKMASRITVLEVDCTAKKVRGVSESTFARNGARDLIKETPAPPGAPWAAYEDAPAFEAYFDAICATKLAG